MKNIKKKIGECGKGKSILLFASIQPILFLTLTFIFALICYNSKDPTANTEIYSMVALLLAGGAGSFAITTLGGEYGAYSALFSSLCSCILIFMFAFISSEKVTLGALMNILCFILISMLGILIGKHKKNSHITKRHKKH